MHSKNMENGCMSKYNHAVMSHVFTQSQSFFN